MRLADRASIPEGSCAHSLVCAPMLHGHRLCEPFKIFRATKSVLAMLGVTFGVDKGISLLADEGLMPANHFSDLVAGSTLRRNHDAPHR